jgi:putative transcriptional regulator
MGIMVNRPASSIEFPELLVQLNIIKKADQIKLPENAEGMKVLRGGPVDTGRGFVLHSSDFRIENATLPIDDKICLTATVDILRAIAKGTGPKRAILALGYAGWAPGQLETEIQDNGWLHCDADSDLIFGGDVEEKYARALRKIGIDPGMLSNEAGHA